MVWRETISTTATMGFRIEGVRMSDGTSSKDFKTIRTEEKVKEALADFVESFPQAAALYLSRLHRLRAALQLSPFFASHEVSSGNYFASYDLIFTSQIYRHTY
jgi:1D-myo-inositol-triphosphate 3-kinase